MKNNVNSFKQWRDQGGWQRCSSGTSCELCFGDCNGCCWCPPRSHLQTCPPISQLLDCWLLTVHGCLFLWRITLSRMGVLIWEVMLPYLPTGYGQWLTDTGVWKAGFFAFRWCYLLVQCVLQNSLWDRVETEFPVRPHDCVTPPPAPACSLTSFSPKKSHARNLILGSASRELNS